MKHLKLLLRSLIKNDACVEGGRTYPWWVAVIFFFLSTAISLIPTTVTLFTVDAGTLITQAAYDTDKGFYQVLEAMEKDGIDLQFYNEHTVENFNELKDDEGNQILPYAKLTGEWKNGDIVDGELIKKPYVVTERVITKYTTTTAEDGTITTEVEEQDVEIFKLYVFDELNQEQIATKVTAVLQGLNPYVTDAIEGQDATKNNTSFALFGKNSFVWVKYNSNKMPVINDNGDIQGFTPAGQFTGTYKDIASIKFLSELKKPTLTETVDDTAIFLNEAFNEIKLQNAGIQLAIYLAINAGIVLLMGFVLWLMTRGKNNPFRCYKIWETMKIATWTAFTPALLSMILGFLIGSSNPLAGFMFVLVFGIRSMWLAMKNLKPAPNQ